MSAENSIFRVRRFTEWPKPLHWIASPVEFLTKVSLHWIPCRDSVKRRFSSLISASSHPLPQTPFQRSGLTKIIRPSSHLKSPLATAPKERLEMLFSCLFMDNSPLDPPRAQRKFCFCRPRRLWDREERSIHHHRGNPPFFLFWCLRLYGVYPSFRTYGVYPFPLFSQENGIHHSLFFALWPRGRATDQERRGCHGGGVILFFSLWEERLKREREELIGACAITTKFLDNRICTLKIWLSWRFPRKTAFLDDFPLCPQGPNPPQKCKFYFYCRLAVSELRWGQTGERKGGWGWGSLREEDASQRRSESRTADIVASVRSASSLLAIPLWHRDSVLAKPRVLLR